VSGLTLESFWLIPVAVVTLFAVAQFDPAGIIVGTVSPGHTLLVASAGVATAVPLLLFAAGTRRIDLSLVGMIQFITPVMQFLVGGPFLGVQLVPEGWVGFRLLLWVNAVFVPRQIGKRGLGRR